MSKFERTYQIDPSREKDYQREYSSIELSDEEYLAKIKQYRPYEPCKSVGLADTLEPKKEMNAQVESEKPKRKPTKANSRANKTTVARVQKKL